MKKFLSLVLSTALVASMTTVSFAAENIKVLFNGQQVQFTDVNPETRNGRTMVPFSKLFETFGAEATYDQETKEIKGTLGEKVITLKENSNQAVVVNEGKEETMTMDVAPYTKNDRLLVPLSVISQYFGYDVYWNNNAQTVNVLDKEKIITELDKKYTVYNNFVQAEEFDINKTYKTDINAGFDMTVDDETNPVKAIVDAKMQALSQGVNMNLDGTAKVQVTSGETKIDQNVTFDSIFNLEDGKIFVKSEQLAALNPELKDAWIKIDFSDYMAGMDMSMFDELQALLTGQKSEMTLGNIIYTVSYAMKDQLSEMGMDVYSYIQTMDKMYGAIIGDEAMKVTTENGQKVYTSTLDKAKMAEMLGVNASDLAGMDKFDMTMKLYEKNEKLVDASVKMAVAGEGMEMTMDFRGNEKDANGTIVINVPPVNMKMTIDAKSVETTETVKTAPASTEKVVDLMELFAVNTAAIGAIGGADGPTEITVAVPEVAA